MPTNIPYPNVGYTLSQSPLTNLYPLQVIAKRDPSTADRGILGQLWINKVTGAGFLLVKIAANTWTWQNVGGGSGSFTTLAVSGAATIGTTLTVGTGLTVTAGNITATNGNLVLGTAGNKLVIPTGTNASIGVSAAMAAGTTTITTTAVTASSRIFLTHATAAGTLGELSVGTVTAGTSFVINSNNAADTSTVNWLIIN